MIIRWVLFFHFNSQMNLLNNHISMLLHAHPCSCHDYLKAIKIIGTNRMEASGEKVGKHPGSYPVFRFPWAKPKRQSSVAKTYVNMKIARETQTQKLGITTTSRKIKKGKRKRKRGKFYDRQIGEEEKRWLTAFGDLGQLFALCKCQQHLQFRCNF